VSDHCRRPFTAGRQAKHVLVPGGFLMIKVTEQENLKREV
jgi:hypothetical protein